MIDIVIEAQSGEPIINVRFDDSISIEDLRAAWGTVLEGSLQRHIRDAIWFECVRRGFAPSEVVADPPQLN